MSKCHTSSTKPSFIPSQKEALQPGLPWVACSSPPVLTPSNLRWTQPCTICLNQETKGAWGQGPRGVYYTPIIAQSQLYGIQKSLGPEPCSVQRDRKWESVTLVCSPAPGMPPLGIRYERNNHLSSAPSFTMRTHSSTKAHHPDPFLDPAHSVGLHVLQSQSPAQMRHPLNPDPKSTPMPTFILAKQRDTLLKKWILEVTVFLTFKLNEMSQKCIWKSASRSPEKNKQHADKKTKTLWWFGLFNLSV